MARRRAVAISAPTRARAIFTRRQLTGVLIFLGVCVVVLAVTAGLFTFRIITDHNDTENLTPSAFLLTNYESVSFTNRAGGEHEGWLLRGLKGAPVIILCPGYDSNRSDLLPLGAVLQENHFNVYMFNFRGARTKRTLTNLGGQQAEDLQLAVAKISKLPGINSHRVGLFGVTTGGYATLVTALQSPLVKAIAVDSVYERPNQMFDAELDRLMGGPGAVFRIMAEAEFHLVNLGTKNPPIRENLSKLKDMPKLFISGRDTPLLASITEDLYNLVPGPKRLLVLEHSQTAQASGSEKKEYENQVLSFFLQNLPLRAD